MLTCNKQPGSPLHVSGLPGMHVARPKLGTASKVVGYMETPENIEAIDRCAGLLGMMRSDYLRDLVRKDLAKA